MLQVRISDFHLKLLENQEFLNVNLLGGYYHGWTSDNTSLHQKVQS